MRVIDASESAYMLPYMQSPRTLVSYKLTARLHRELKRASRASRRDMTSIVEDAVREWLVAHRWLSTELLDGELDSERQRARSKEISKVARTARRHAERMPGRHHDEVLYGDRR